MENFNQTKCTLCLSSEYLLDLGCDHSICSDCIYKIVLFNNDEFQIIDKTTYDYKCPLCEKEHKNLQKELIFDTLTKPKPKSPLICTRHNLPIESYCHNCPWKMCSACLSVHDNIPVEHKITKFVKEINLKCSNHNSENINHFCLQCNTSICNICYFRDHSDHHDKVKLIIDYENQIKSEISKTCLKNKNFDEISDILDKEEKNFISDINNYSINFNDKINSLIVSLNDIRDNFNKQIDNYKEEKLKTITILKKATRSFYDELQDISNVNIYNLQTLKKLTNVDFLLNFKLNCDDEFDEALKKIRESINKMNQVKMFKEKSSKNIIKELKGECVNTLQGHTNVVSSLVLLPDGKLASGAYDKSIRIWDTNNNFNCVNTLQGHTSYVLSLVLLPDGKLASGSYDNTIRIWETNNNFNCVKTLQAHTGWVTSLVLLPDGKLASGSDDNTIRIWETNNNFNCVKTLQGHTSWVTSLVLLPDGKLASGSGDTSIRIWETNNNFNCVKTLKGHTNVVSSLVLLPDGKLASGSGDTTIRIWDTNNNFNCVKTLQGHTSGVLSLVLLPDGKLASGSCDTTIRIWE